MNDDNSGTQPRDDDVETHSEPAEALERDPETAPNAPNRDPAAAPDADELVNQTDASDGQPQSDE